ncbi:hypothetical protein CI238_09777 [Colletotrichum incanum]|uniref:Uncharacterized protein n=1 Tax=Colletotrichum incanum TaxID=1573173 RepID=A0A162P9E4_COLIC|nr:hypothetical protein CI238_09777 [Colletotrichum incanum]
MPTPPQLPNSTWATSANATLTATNHASDLTTSKVISTAAQVSTSVPSWPVSNSTTLIWATSTTSAPLSTSIITSRAQFSTFSSLVPPWATFNSTLASVTGTVSITMITAPTVTATDITSAPSASFPWTNITISRPLTGSLTASVITVSMTAGPSLSINDTVLQTTGNGTWPQTSVGSTATLVPPSLTGNLTLISGPTGVKPSSILLSTVISGIGITTASTSIAFSSTDLPPFPTANSASSLPTTRNATITVSGSIVTLVSTLTGVPVTLTSSITGPPFSTTLPPFPTKNSTLTPGSTASGTRISHTASGTVLQTESSSGTLLTTISSPFPIGNATVSPGPTGNVTITWISRTTSDPLPPTLTTTRVNNSVTEIITIISSSGISPPFPTSNSTVDSRPTGTFTGTGVITMTDSGTGRSSASSTPGSSTWGQWPNMTTSNTVFATGVPTLASGTVFATTSSNMAISSDPSTSISSTASRSPSPLPPFVNSTTISGVVPTSNLTWTISGTVISSFSMLPVPTLPHSSSSMSVQTFPGTGPNPLPTRTSGSVSRISSFVTVSRTSPLPSVTISDQITITNSTGLPSGISTPCYIITITNDTVTQVVTRSVLITPATASADPTVVYAPSSTNGTVMSSEISCTSKWQNITSTASAAGFSSTWTSLGLTNRTSFSLNSPTTFVTSTTSRLDDPNRGNNALPAESNFVFGTPTTTITDAPLPPNSAYPWGGLGPVFRHHDEFESRTGGSSSMKPEGQRANGA